MNQHSIQSLLSILFLCVIHLFANRMYMLGWVWHGRFLSLAGGISFAYVFVSLLPEIAEGQQSLEAAFQGFFPYLERHVYVIALLGFLFFYGLQSIPPSKDPKSFDLPFWVSMGGYTLFNLLIGSAVADPNNPDVKPLFLFSFAMGLHYFVNDHNLREKHKEDYDAKGRFVLTGAIILGWLIGTVLKIPEALIALLVSFAAGGVMLNVMRYELPQKGQGGILYFNLGAILYTALLLGVGEKQLVQ